MTTQWYTLFFYGSDGRSNLAAFPTLYNAMCYYRDEYKPWEKVKPMICIELASGKYILAARADDVISGTIPTWNHPGNMVELTALDRATFESYYSPGG